ncbi:MAG TPA: ABC transporter ATP-binding protein [Lacunisphaera sp.]|nr:ABC transporter ATP-binding protein [Lacunisphaera sp.]
MKWNGANPWAVEIDGFAKRYPGGWWGAGPGTAVEGLTLRLAPGQVLGILGPNGSGKSTVLKALAGLIRPSTGSCCVFGHPAGSDAARTRVGYLPEAPRFSPHLTSREVLAFCAGLSAFTGFHREMRVQQLLHWSGLEEVADRRIGGFSKGMVQRLAVAQAILHDPDLVLLDEPADGLDPVARLGLERLLCDLAAHGRTIIFTSHLLARAEAICDRIALLGAGRLLAEGTPGELLGDDAFAAPEVTPLERLYLDRFAAHA